MLEDRLKIEKLICMQDIIKLTLHEKDADLLKAQDVLAEVHNDIAVLQKTMNSKEQQLIEATTRLREKEDHILTTQLELDDLKAKFHETGSSVEQLAQLTSKLALSVKGEDSGGISTEQLESGTLLAKKPKMKELVSVVNMTLQIGVNYTVVRFD